MRTTQLVIFLLAAGLSLTAVAALTGGVTFGENRPIDVIKGAGSDEGAGSAEVEKVWIGRGAPEPSFQINKQDMLKTVSIPLIDEATGREDGRLTCARIHYHEATDRMRLEKPVVLMWEIDKVTGQVDQTRETRIVAADMFLDRQHREAEMVGDVVVTNQYRQTEPRLETSRLSFLLDERKIHTEAPVRMLWGPDTTLTGQGLKGDANLEMIAIQREGRMELVQAGTRMLTPLEKVDPTVKKVKLVATCRGELIASNVFDPKERARKKAERKAREAAKKAGKPLPPKKDVPEKPSLSLIQLRERVSVVREKATLTSESLDLWLEQKAKAGSGSGSGSGEDAGPSGDLREMLAKERVVIKDPDGECYGQSFHWKRKGDRQLMVLSGAPRVIGNDAGQMSLVDAPSSSAKKTREKIEITCAGKMTFDRRSPESVSKELDVAVCTDDVRVRRTVVALDGPDAGKPSAALEVDGEKLTLWSDRVERATKAGKTRTASEMKRALVEGDVSVRDRTFVCTGQRCDWTRPSPESERMVVTGTPRMIVRDVEDDRGMEIGDAEAAPAAPRRIDIDIAAKTRLVIAGGGKDGGRQLEFFDAVKVLRWELGKDGKRVSDEPLPSQLASDQLRVDLERATGPKAQDGQMAMRNMLAKGNVRLDDAGGRSTSQVMRYDKEKGALVLERQVVVHDQDGGRYTGDRMEYDRAKRVGVLHGSEKTDAVARLPVESADGAGSGAGRAQKFHVVKAPTITFARGKGYMHAQVKEAWQNVTGTFYPSEEDGDFIGLGDTPEPGEEKRPWKLTCKDLEAWLNPRQKRAPGEKKPAGGRLKKLIAKSTGSTHVELRSVMPAGQEAKQQIASGKRFEHEKGKDGEAITRLIGGREPASVRSAREQLKSSLIVMVHKTGLAECPKGGWCKFMETDPDDPKAAPKPVQITCDGKLLYKRNDWVEFHENVVVRRSADNSSLKCDYLKCFLDKKTRQMQKAVGTGKQVVIVSGQDMATGTRVDWNATEKKMVLTGKPTCELARGGELFRAPVVVFDQKTGRVTTPKGMEKLR